MRLGFVFFFLIGHTETKKISPPQEQLHEQNITTQINKTKKTNKSIITQTDFFFILGFLMVIMVLNAFFSGYKSPPQPRVEETDAVIEKYKLLFEKTNIKTETLLIFLETLFTLNPQIEQKNEQQENQEEKFLEINLHLFTEIFSTFVKKPENKKILLNSFLFFIETATEIERKKENKQNQQNEDLILTTMCLEFINYIKEDHSNKIETEDPAKFLEKFIKSIVYMLNYFDKTPNLLFFIKDKLKLIISEIL